MLADVILRAVVKRSLLSATVLQEVQASLSSTGGDSSEELLDRLYRDAHLSRENVLAALGEAFSMETVTSDELHPPAELLDLVSRDRAREAGLLPLRWNHGTLVVAIGDPTNLEPLDQLAHLLEVPVEPVLADVAAFREALGRTFPAAEAAADVSATPPDEELSVPTGAKASEEPLSGDGPVERYVSHLLEEAVRLRASDIHLEPMERRFRVRLRVDGHLKAIEDPPKALQLPVISRLKLMAGMSIDEKRMPQDGRIRHRGHGCDLDIRVSSLPSVHGETLVLRLLDAGGRSLGLADIGLLPRDEARFRRLISRANGMVLVTGPTGAGKTTTLYAVLRHLNEAGKKLITVEDPVEYQIAGINHVPVRRSVGLDFAAALRAVLRQSPNIIMIGEIRDAETAKIAVNASFTGHLVLSTLHTNDAPGAVSRLVDMGVEPFLVAAALRGVLAQRLVRRLCGGCRGKRCSECQGNGFRGRIGIFELLEVSAEIAASIHQAAPLDALRRRARVDGMRTLREDGEEKAAMGLTTIEEVLAATVSDHL